MIAVNNLNSAIRLLLLVGLAFHGTVSVAAPLNIGNLPLFTSTGVPPLTMLIMGKDHKLYYEAYNDASDLDGDGAIDVGYKPASILYYGYFDSFKCYVYDSGNGRFNPVSISVTKKCSGQWSGDFLNYLTTTRMDALRKVFLGGYRSTDTNSETVLERVFIPQDAHSWGKEYQSIGRDGYDISEYTPLSVPTGGNYHLFAVTTLSFGSGEPVFRVLQNKSNRIWEWVSKEQPVADNSFGTPTEYSVRVKVCVASMPEINCQLYSSGFYKPVGLLQEYGESDRMFFGLITGSYAKNTSGGVLRKAVTSITNEINTTTGQFVNGSNGIFETINNLQIIEFTSGYAYQPGWPGAWITTRAITEGEQPNWGNPVAEMMYEGLRYFAGKATPTTDYSISSTTNPDATLGLPVATWDDPYATYPRCSKPFEMVISDINPSYDTDQIPGTSFGSYSGDITGLDVTTLADTISANEPDVAGSHFIGQSGAVTDGSPSAKTVTSLGNIRGLAPEEPTKLGGYYSSSIAYYAHTNDINLTAADDQIMDTFSVALASPLPRIEIDANGQNITLVPYAKSVGGCLGISPALGDFQPTNQIVDFYAETVTSTYGKFRINFEDVEQGADHDMDAIAVYEYTVNGNGSITVNMTATYAAGCIIQHLGYVISGTTEDGTFLEIRDLDTAAGSDVDYFGDTPPGQLPGGIWNDSTALPLTTSRTFIPNSGGNTATLLKNPLWYAAKWGGFLETEQDSLPDDLLPQGSEWDADTDGDPDNYFLVTNALNLKSQLANAFDEIIDRTASASTAAINTGSITSNTKIFQALFKSTNWTGQLLAFPINADGTIGTLLWDAADLIPPANNRVILTQDGSLGQPFRWANLTAQQKTYLNNDTTVLDYIRGDQSNEASNGGAFRNRTKVLGDLVNSAPVHIGQPNFRYPNNWNGASTEPEDAVLYSTFKSTVNASNSGAGRTPVVYVGANDGMLHAFDGNTGIEIFAYVPNAVFQNLHVLSDTNYPHNFYVDGSPTVVDAFINSDWRTVLVGGLRSGGQGIYALDVTDPSSFGTEIAGKANVLWEFTDIDDADLGYTYSQPSIVRLHNGNWGAVFGNGYNNTVDNGNDGSATNDSTTGNAVLYIVNLESGALIKKIDTGVGTADDPTGNSRPNGLATASPVDVNGDSIADYIYAGDLFGNLWKFDISNSNPNQWDVAFMSGGNPQPLFTACSNAVCSATNHQPITSAPQIGRHPQSFGFLVYFGTGQYLETADNTSTGQNTQSFYGIWDRNESSLTAFTRDHLLKQEILLEVVDFGFDLRVSSDNSIYWHPTSDPTGLPTVPVVPPNNPTHLGWYLDLINTEGGNTDNLGERQVSNSILRNGRIIFTTLVPSSDVCEFGGTSWLMELDADTGSRLAFTPFDLNGDKKFTNADYVTVNIDGNDVTVPVSGKGSTVGVTSAPGILAGPGGDEEFKYTSGSSGAIESHVENPGPLDVGRQSWLQY